MDSQMLRGNAASLQGKISRFLEHNTGERPTARGPFLCKHQNSPFAAPSQFLPLPLGSKASTFSL